MIPHRDEVRIRATVVGLTPGNTASVTISRETHHNNKSRTMVQKLQMSDELFARLLRDVSIGQDIEATIITEWRKSGYRTYLAEFQSVAAIPAGNERVA